MNLWSWWPIHAHLHNPKLNHLPYLYPGFTSVCSERSNHSMHNMNWFHWMEKKKSAVCKKVEHKQQLWLFRHWWSSTDPKDRCNGYGGSHLQAKLQQNVSRHTLDYIFFIKQGKKRLLDSWSVISFGEIVFHLSSNAKKSNPQKTNSSKMAIRDELIGAFQVPACCCCYSNKMKPFNLETNGALSFQYF